MSDLLPGESLLTDILVPGQRVIWNHVPRGGYGFLEPVPATVVRQIGNYVTIRVPLRAGKLATRRVHRVSVAPAHATQVPGKEGT